MNFFGHSVVASAYSAEPAFVLGAMLPDFATMIGARPPSSADDAVRAGIECHHATDNAFHDAPTFRELHDRALADLRRAGVRSGPARAVAHVGVEIVMDGRLAQDREHARVYLDAIGSAGNLASAISWSGITARVSYSVLVRRLVGFGVRGPQPSEAITERLDMILAHRPRLAMNDGDRAAVAEWVLRGRRSIEDRALDAVREVHAELGRASGRERWSGHRKR